MTIDICPLIDDAASYVLRAMPDGEWEQYEAHVHDCQVCTAKIEELGFVSDALLNAVPQLSAPPDIRSRVMAVVHAEAELLNAAGAMADRPIVRQPSQRFSLLRLRPWPAAALAVSLLALGIGGGALLTGSGSTGDPAARSLACASAPDGASCTMRVAGDSAKLVVAGLTRSPGGPHLPGLAGSRQRHRARADRGPVLRAQGPRVGRRPRRPERRRAGARDRRAARRQRGPDAPADHRRERLVGRPARRHPGPAGPGLRGW